MLVKKATSEALRLLDTLVIKSESSCAATNRELALLGHSISSDPYTWKYYMNLYGEYHDTDIPMYITSLDHGDRILFSKSELENNRLTRIAYRQKSSYYDTLVSEHPSQADLIRGIVSPVRTDVALAALDGSILEYDKRFIEPQEASLIKRLESKIDQHNRRWYRKQYSAADYLYLPGHIASMYSMLLLEIRNYRESMINTPECHTMLLRGYLSNYYNIGKHVDNLSWEQCIYLYNNIYKLRLKIGSNENLESILKNFVSIQNIDIFSKTLQQSNIGMIDSGSPTVISSDINMLNKDEINRTDNVLMDESDSSVRDRIINSIEASAESVIWTRVTNAVCTASSISAGIDFRSYVIRHWLTYALHDRIDGTIAIVPPRSRSTIQLTMREAAILYLSASKNISKSSANRLGSIIMSDIHREHIFSTDEIVSSVGDQISRDAIMAYTNGSIPMPYMFTPRTFSYYIQAIYYQYLRQTYMLANDVTASEAAVLKSIRDMQYISVKCLDGMKYKTMEVDCSGKLKTSGIDTSEYTSSDWRYLMQEIMNNACDIDLDTVLVDVDSNYQSTVEVVNAITSYNYNITESRKPSYHISNSTPPVKTLSIALDSYTSPVGQLLLPATLDEAEEGIIDHKYITPKTLHHRVSIMENEFIEVLNNALSNLVEKFKNVEL